jgi:flagellar biosynthesis protein FlhG
MEPTPKLRTLESVDSFRSGAYHPPQPSLREFGRRRAGGARILAVGGGKGGVGKSFVACNIGAEMARLGRRVVLVDADLGGANLHTYLGLEFPGRTLNDLLTHRVDHIHDVIVPTPFPNLQLISGAQNVLGAANPRYDHKARIARAIRELDADVVILDLGSGTSYNTLDFFLVSDEGIFIVVPEPTSLENAYAFIKASFFRKLRRAATDARIKTLVDRVADGRAEQSIRTPADLLAAIDLMDPRTGARLRDDVRAFRLRVVMNQVRSVEDIQLGFAIRKVCRRYFGVDVDYLGYVNYDNAVWKSIKRRNLLLVEYPLSEPAEFIGRMARKLLQPDGAASQAEAPFAPGGLRGSG